MSNNSIFGSSSDKISPAQMTSGNFGEAILKKLKCDTFEDDINNERKRKLDFSNEGLSLLGAQIVDPRPTTEIPKRQRSIKYCNGTFVKSWKQLFPKPTLHDLNEEKKYYLELYASLQKKALELDEYLQHIQYNIGLNAHSFRDVRQFSDHSKKKFDELSEERRKLAHELVDAESMCIKFTNDFKNYDKRETFLFQSLNHFKFDNFTHADNSIQISLPSVRGQD
jgi:hypothetical protein